MEEIKGEPRITVGIMDRQAEVAGRLQGSFTGQGFAPLCGGFSARAMGGMVLLCDETREVARSPSIRLGAAADAAFRLFGVTIGRRFHWERAEDQTFQGDLLFRARPDGTMAVINQIPLEDYLVSVISSEMSATAPLEFLKAHAVLSRSWLLAALGRKDKSRAKPPATGKSAGENEVIRWYEREDHDLFDVCADDHCQRYQGVLKAVSPRAQEAVRATRGRVLTYGDEICDARYSKACGGITEEFGTAWEDQRVPYLASTPDATGLHAPIQTEEEAARWILGQPEAYCRTKDENLLRDILPAVDRETINFFRWKIEYSREELEEILREKSGFDFGALREIVPLRRGPSGRIFRLRITGSQASVVVGKELEIRRWLSRSHLYSSAFIVKVQYDAQGSPEAFSFHGAGWGHGVGLCQIGAAVMAGRGFAAQEILSHYFRGAKISRLY